MNDMVDQALAQSRTAVVERVAARLAGKPVELDRLRRLSPDELAVLMEMENA